MGNNEREEMITFIEGLKDGAEQIKQDLLDGKEWFDTLENVEKDITAFDTMIAHLQSNAMNDIEDQFIRDQYLSVCQMFFLAKTMD